MGKTLTQQKRGKGSPTYRSNSFNFAGDVSNLQGKGTVVDIINSVGHTAPLLVMKYEDNKNNLIIAPEGIRVGDVLEKGDNVPIKLGNCLPLSKIPEGVIIFNLETVPGDGGRLVKSSGGFAKIVSKTKNKVFVKLPSGKQKEFNPKCFATVGLIAGAGRTDKPFMKAGIKFKAMKAKGKYWPSVSAASMNAVDNPLGGARSSRKGRSTIAPRNAPPGRKVGMIRPRHTGRNR